MTPDEFTERFAHYLLAPWDRASADAAMIAAMVHNVVQSYMAAKAGKTLQRGQLLQAEQLQPLPLWAKRHQHQKRLSSDGSLENLAKVLGCK